MNVGRYKGEIRGPFPREAAKALIERKDATLAESIGDGKFRVVEEVQEQESLDQTAVAADMKQAKKGRK